VTWREGSHEKEPSRFVQNYHAEENREEEGVRLGRQRAAIPHARGEESTRKGLYARGSTAYRPKTKTELAGGNSLEESLRSSMADFPAPNRR